LENSWKDTPNFTRIQCIQYKQHWLLCRRPNKIPLHPTPETAHPQASFDINREEAPPFCSTQCLRCPHKNSADVRSGPRADASTRNSLVLSNVYNSDTEVDCALSYWKMRSSISAIIQHIQVKCTHGALVKVVESNDSVWRDAANTLTPGLSRTCCVRSCEFSLPQVLQLRQFTIPCVWKMSSSEKNVFVEIIITCSEMFQHERYKIKPLGPVLDKLHFLCK
jgi:hypothetical protein